MKILNTLSKTLEEFKPISSNRVNFYHCGPTVYWTQHIGNMRAIVLSDFIVRSLRYLGYKVVFVRNYTDVGHLTGDNLGDADQGEDRMEKAAKREKLDPQTIANKYIKEFEHDTDILNTIEPNYKPRATEVIPESIKMIQVLINKGFVYTTDLAIYFDISKAKNYSALSGQSIDDKLQGTGRAEVQDPQKKHPADFIVWVFKAGKHTNALQAWPSPFSSSLVKNGEGFPGWHLECSVMSKKFLGDTVDIHMGGREHIPIHHPNEIAQSEAANGVKFVHYWLHNEWLMANNAKISKSIGNGYSVKEIINKGFDPLALRYFFLGAHYRSRQNFTWEALESAQTALDRLKGVIRSLSLVHPGEIDSALKEQFTSHLENDFNVPQALAVTWDVAKSKDLSDEFKKATLLDFDKVLGLKLNEVKEEKVNITLELQELLNKRVQARKDKDFDLSDKLRTQIEVLGYTVEDTPGGQVTRSK